MPSNASSKTSSGFTTWTGPNFSIVFRRTKAEPFARQVADAGDVACTPFGIEQAIGEVEQTAKQIAERAAHVLALGGDHTIALPLLRAAAARFGPLRSGL